MSSADGLCSFCEGCFVRSKVGKKRFACAAGISLISINLGIRSVDILFWSTESLFDKQ